MRTKTKPHLYGLLLLTAGAALFSAIAPAQAADKKPNILIMPLAAARASASTSTTPTLNANGPTTVNLPLVASTKASMKPPRKAGRL